MNLKGSLFTKKKLGLFLAFIEHLKLNLVICLHKFVISLKINQDTNNTKSINYNFFLYNFNNTKHIGINLGKIPSNTSWKLIVLYLLVY